MILIEEMILKEKTISRGEMILKKEIISEDEKILKVMNIVS